MSDPLAPADVTFVIEGQVNVMISITELGDGTLKLVAKVLDETGEIGDLRGLFFDVADESLISGLRITGSGVTGTQFSDDAVFSDGGGAHVPRDTGVALPERRAVGDVEAEDLLCHREDHFGFSVGRGD